MRFAKHYQRLFCVVPTTVGILAQAVPAAQAHDVYPPGWNVRHESVGPILYDFRISRSGCWGDYRRYWPGQKSCMESVPSRPMTYGSVTDQMEPGGHRYHRAEESAVAPTGAYAQAPER
jgi:hypothetical protein